MWTTHDVTLIRIEFCGYIDFSFLLDDINDLNLSFSTGHVRNQITSNLTFLYLCSHRYRVLQQPLE